MSLSIFAVQLCPLLEVITQQRCQNIIIRLTKILERDSYFNRKGSSNKIFTVEINVSFHSVFTIFSKSMMYYLRGYVCKANKHVLLLFGLNI